MSKKRRIKENSINPSTDSNAGVEYANEKIQSGNSKSRISVAAYLKNYWWAVAIVAFLSISTLAGGLKYLEDNANRQIAENKGKLANSQNQSFLSSINPFISAPSPTPTPTPLPLSKEYIYAGSRLLAVEDANASAAPPTDLAVWRPSSGYWYVLGGQGSQQTSVQWGANGDKPVPGDYDGDGKTDFAVYRPDNPATSTDECANNCSWYIVRSSDGSYLFQPFGLNADKPAPADYDGDGKTDLAFYRPENPTTPEVECPNGSCYWYILRSSNGALETRQYGVTTDSPVPADYDGDGRADSAVWRNSDATFYVLKSSGGFTGGQVGQTGSEPVPGDYDGDGRADYAVRNGDNWIIDYSSSSQPTETISWGQADDKAVQNDYDGDGKVDIAIWGATNGVWYIRNSTNPSQPRVVQWGTAGDIPVPAFYRR